MLNEISQIVVFAFGVLVCVLSVWGIIVPDKMMKFVYGAVEKDWGIHLAVVLRLILGAALVIVAPESRFPLIFEILGWIAIVAAVGLVLMGRARLRKFVAWFQRMPQPLIRIWLLFGVAFGALLVYGVV
jgi:hypothetical protein